MVSDYQVLEGDDVMMSPSKFPPGGVQAVGEDTSVDMEMVRGLIRRFEGALAEGAIGEWE